MSISTFENDPVEFDKETAGWLGEYVAAKEQIRKWTEIAERARQVVESSLGDSTIGTINGQPVVRYATITSRRFDVKKARELLPAEIVDRLQVETTTRRFDLVDPSKDLA